MKLVTGLKKLFGEIQRLATADGALFALAMIPSTEQVDHDQFDELIALAGESNIELDWDFPERKLSEICGELDLPFVGLANPLREQAPASVATKADEDFFFGGLGHWNPRANKIAGERLYDFLAEPSADGTSLLAQLMEPQAPAEDSRRSRTSWRVLGLARVGVAYGAYWSRFVG